MKHLLVVALVAVMPVGNATADPAERTNPEVLFSFNSSLVNERSTAKLDAIVAQALETPNTRVVLDAHTDATGASPYNVGLSVRRAVQVRNYLTSRGIAAERIVLAAYGEDGPRRASPALDRRVSVTLTAEPIYSIIDRSGPNVTGIFWHEPLTLAAIQGPPDKVPQTARR